MLESFNSWDSHCVLLTHLNEVIWTNNLTIHFDDVLWHYQLSLHMNDRIKLAEMLINYVNVYQHINARFHSKLWVEKGTNEQCLGFSKSSQNEHLFRFSVYANYNFFDCFQVFSHGKFLFVHGAFVAEKFIFIWAGLKKSEHFWINGTKKCGILLDIQLHIQISENENLYYSSKPGEFAEKWFKEVSWGSLFHSVFVFCRISEGTLEKLSA